MIGPYAPYANVGDNMPFVSKMGSRQPQFPSIFFSEREHANIIPKTARAGFGALLPGTIMAVSSYDYTLVPYVIAEDPTINAGQKVVGKSFLTADLPTTTSFIYVSYMDSVRFVVGEDIVLMRSNSGTAAYFDGGAITGITYPSSNIAKIAFTNASTDANFTMANYACAYPKSGVTTKFNKAVYVMDEFLDTGLGPVANTAPNTAVGGLASCVIGNAVLYYGRLINIDSGAITDLGGTVDGQFFYIK